MSRFRISMLEMFMLVALTGILVPFLVHVHQQTASHEIVWAIELSPDRKLLARGSDLGVAVFDLNLQRLVARFGVPAGCLAFSTDSRLIAAGGVDGSVTIWDLATGQLHRRFQGHTEWVRSIKFSPDSTRLYSASRDKTVKVWQVSNAELAGHVSVPNRWL